jgi:hypothetical protein
LIYPEHECSFKVKVSNTAISLNAFSITSGDTIKAIQKFYQNAITQVNSKQDSTLIDLTTTQDTIDKNNNWILLWHSLYYTLCIMLPDNIEWLYRFRVDFTDNICIQYNSCVCGCKYNRINRFDRKSSNNFTSIDNHNYNYNHNHKHNISVHNINYSSEVIVESLDEAILVRNYYGAKIFGVVLFKCFSS